MIKNADSLQKLLENNQEKYFFANNNFQSHISLKLMNYNFFCWSCE